MNSCRQSSRSDFVATLARLGTARAFATQRLKFGGSGMITGDPGCCAAWLLAATNSQWLNACVVIGFPAMSATELPGTPLPHAARAIATTKKAPSALILPATVNIRTADGSERA